MVEQSAIIQVLYNAKDPDMERDIFALHFISGIDLHKHKAVIHFQSVPLVCPLLDWIITEIKKAVLQVKDSTEVEVVLETAADREASDRGELYFGGIDHINRVKKVIVVMSGKGGVGKLLVADLLIFHLNRAGYRVGSLGVGINGPSIPKMFFEERPEVNDTPRAILSVVSKAGIEARKAANMVRQIGIPVLGLVENMSFFKAPDTGKEYEIFGPSHAEVTARRLIFQFWLDCRSMPVLQYGAIKAK